MKYIKALIFFVLAAYSFYFVLALPTANVKNIRGENVDTKTLSNDGKPYLVVFFGVCCGSSLHAMNELNEHIEDWKNEYSLKIYAISIDDSRNTKKVPAIAKGRNWGFEIYLDENQNFKRAMNVNDKPHYFIFNGEGENIWQQVGYSAGIENIISDELEKHFAKK